jgi:hypothetical protein
MIFQLTTLVTALMAKFWGSQIDEHYVKVICTLGPLIYFEGYLSVSKPTLIPEKSSITLFPFSCMERSGTFGVI